MPFVLLIVGVVLVVAGVRNTQSLLLSLLKQDFTGQGSFIPWFVAILAIGAVGYVKPLKPIVTAFLVLLIIVLFLSNGGFFQKFISATGIGSTGGISTPSLSIGSSNSSNTLQSLSPLQSLQGS